MNFIGVASASGNSDKYELARRDQSSPLPATQLVTCTSAAPLCVNVDTMPTTPTCSKTPKQHRINDTPRKQLLKRKMKRLQSRSWKLHNKVKELRSTNCKKSALPTMSVSQISDAASKNLTPLQHSLFEKQMRASNRQPHGLRWSASDKLFSLQLLYKSASAYRFVAKHLHLPGVSTLRKFVSATVGHIGEGFYPVLLAILRQRISQLPERDRQCSLVFDEMAIKCNVTYNKHQDKIIGFTHDGQLANEALVFMLRGLSMKWKED